MAIQRMSWGYIDWLYSVKDGLPGQSMNVGICVIMPKQRQHKHVHYGIEQFIYLLKGESRHIINGEERLMSKNGHLHMEPGVTHDTINDGDIPAVELLVSVPVTYSQNLGLIDDAQLPQSPYETNLYAAVEAIRAQLMESYQAPFTIFDDNNKVIFQSIQFPSFCLEKCRPQAAGGNCKCLCGTEYDMSNDKERMWFICPYGHLVYHLPIVFRTQRLGYIRGGHIVVSELSGDYGHKEVYDTPKSTANAIQNLLQQAIKSILAYCEFDASRQDLKRKNLAIWEKEHHKLALEKTLRLAEDTVTNLRINRHFLFNTLNCMADMALRKKGESLYSAIIQLSKLFRYVMPTDQHIVKLDNELEYVDNYLSLQKLRYSDNLLISKSVDCNLLDLDVPFNFLQPIVENAFTHGFSDRTGLMRLSVAAESNADGRIVITIRNNGAKLDETTLLRVKNAWASNSGHGLSLIYNKLASAYGNDFEMDIESVAKDQTQVRLVLPAMIRG